MTNSTDTKWYTTEAVVSALRDHKLAIASNRDKRTGATLNAVVDSGAYRVLQQAYATALHAAAADRLGTYVLPDMLAAAVIGAPYEWQRTRPLANAEKALDEIEMAYGPVRRVAA